VIETSLFSILDDARTAELEVCPERVGSRVKNHRAGLLRNRAQRSEPGSRDREATGEHVEMILQEHLPSSPRRLRAEDLNLHFVRQLFWHAQASLVKPARAPESVRLDAFLFRPPWPACIRETTMAMMLDPHPTNRGLGWG